MRCKLFNRLLKMPAYMRVRRITGDLDLRYDGLVHSCAKVSGENHDIAYVIHRWGPFGMYSVEKIERPNVVELAETDNCVVVKDGYVYELTRRIR